MIAVEGVSHRIGGALVLDGIDLAVPRGGITALIGPNGAGKSTLLSLMARLERLQAGRVSFDGLDVSRTPTDRLARALAILRQDTAIGARLTVRDLVGFGRHPHSGGRPGPEDRAAVEEALEAFGLGALAGRHVDQLSGGQRQRALLAMTVAQATPYLLLDEPLASLDMAHARGLMRRLRDLADRLGRTVVVVIHEVNYAAAHADRVVGLKEGRVVLDGPVAQALTGPALSALFDTPVRVEAIDGRPVALHYA